MKNFFLLLFIITPGLAFAQTQTIRGKVIDQQSQYPLIGASVFIPGTEPLLGAATDQDGNFEIQRVPLGRVTLKVSYLGYKERLIPNVLLTSGKEVNLSIQLEEQFYTSEEIVITAEEDKTLVNNELAVISARGFDVEESRRYAGSRNDPARMATNYAGVSGANDARNDIIIRGNSPTGLLWRLEGIDIPSPNHFGTLGSTGGPVGMLNNNVLDNSDFFTGAFPAEYGNANAGVFDLKFRNGNNSKREYLFQIGFNGVEAGMEGPFSKNSRASYLVNYRYSTLAVFDAIGLDFGTGSAVPQYQDISFKIDIPTQNAGRFGIFGLGGISQIDLFGSEEDDPDPNDAFGDINNDLAFESGTGVIGLTHTYFYNEKTYSEITLAASGSYSRGENDSLSRNTDGEVVSRFFESATDFNQWRYSLRAQLNRKVNSRHTVRLGASVDLLNLNLVDSMLNQQTREFMIRQDFDGNTSLLQAYAQWRFRISEKMVLNTGLHYQELTLNNSRAFEPRLGLQYKINSAQSLSFGFGLHSQLQPLQVYFQNTTGSNGENLLSNENLDFTKSIHYVLGYDNSINDFLRLKVEAYYQQIYDAPITQRSSSFSLLNAGADFEIPDEDSLFNDGTGYNYGLELTLEKFFSQKYYFLVTSSIFNSRYEGSDGIERNTAYNGNYVFNILFGKEFTVRKKNAFFIDTKVTLAGGRHFTPIDLPASIAQGFAVEDDTQAFDGQFEDYFRWDLKAGYRINARKVTHEFFVDVQNVTNRDNILEQDYNRSTQSIRRVNQLGIFPVVQYKLQF